MCSFRPALLALAVAPLVVSLRAQSSVPTLSQAIPPQSVAFGAAITLDLRNHFTIPGVGGSIAQVDTVVGTFNLELLAADAPKTVANFLSYASAGRYQNTFIHRAVTGFVIQGGGYTATVPFAHIPTFPAVQNEFKVSNTRGTVAMAKLGGDPNSATSEWFVNLADNSANLDTQNGGFSVFARVMGTGMTVVDAIAALPRYKIGFDDPSAAVPASTPLRNVPPNETQLRTEYYVTVTDVRPASLFPTGTGASVLTLTAQSSAPAVAGTTILGSTLTILPIGSGTASITVRAVDTNGNAAETTFPVTVTGPMGSPVFTTQPSSQTVAAGSTAAFNAVATGATSYRWERNGAAISGGTAGTLVVSNVSPADAGSYVCFATNATGASQSATATLSVANVAPLETGRVINLSILTSAGAGAKVLTVGTVIGGGGPGSALPIVIRAVGPTLEPLFNVAGTLADPVMEFFQLGSPTVIGGNDNWGGGAALADAFRSVGAFELPAASLDSAIAPLNPGVTPGGYTVQVTGKGGATGFVIAEIYDAAGAGRTIATPRLMNVSTRTRIDEGTDLAVGFVLRGQSARTVLVRGVGPSLSAFNLTGMADPRLALFNDASQRIGGNDDWGGNPEIAAASKAVGAFNLVADTSKDAVLLVTLPPGAYTARLSGAGGGGGEALVEVYEVP